MTPLPHRKPQVVFTPLNDGIVLLDASQGVYFGLNAVGAEIWQLLPPECQSVDELCSRVSRNHPGVPRETIRRDVEEFLRALITSRLVSFPDAE